MASIRDKIYTHKLRPFHTKNDNHKDNYNNNYIVFMLQLFCLLLHMLECFKVWIIIFGCYCFCGRLFLLFPISCKKNPSENHFNDFVPLCPCYTSDVDFNFFLNIAVFCFTVFLTELK